MRFSRIKPLAEPGGLCITNAINEALPSRLPYDLNSLGEQVLKEFIELVLTKGDNLRARNLFEKARDSDPEFAAP